MKPARATDARLIIIRMPIKMLGVIAEDRKLLEH